MTYDFSMRNPNIDKIIDIVSEGLYITRKDIISGSRKREFVEARQVVMYICKEFTEASLKTIGKHLGDRDHSTIIHGLTTIEGLLFTNKVFRERVTDIKLAVVLAIGSVNGVLQKDLTNEEFYSELLHCKNWEGWKDSKPLEPIEE